MTKSKNKIIIIILILIVIAVIAVISVGMIYSKTNMKEHRVSFYSDDGTLLATEQVVHNMPATPPNNPTLTYGKIFKDWDTDITSVKKDLEIYPNYTDFTDKANVFALSGAYGKQGNTVVVPLVLCGDVYLSGFDISVNYDSNILELDSVFNEDGAVLYNTEAEGVIRINYVSINNTTADVDVCSLKFLIKGEAEQTDLKISAHSICANNDDETFYKPQSNLIDSTIYISPSMGGGFGD